MKRTELVEKLDELGIPNGMYSLDGGLPSETYCIAWNGDEWEFYYSERGLKVALETFNLDEDAYNYLYTVLKKEKSKNYF